MTTIANSAGVFARLGYNFDDPNETIQVFSDETKAQLNAVPALLDSWAGKDLATSNVNAYYKNPVATDVQRISDLKEFESAEVRDLLFTSIDERWVEIYIKKLVININQNSSKNRAEKENEITPHEEVNNDEQETN
jgi:hypothetical protein